MEQRCDSAVTAEEIEVANIFLQLSHLIFESESRRRFYSTWGAKRKRSTASKEEVAVAAISSPVLKISPPPPPPYPPPSLPSNVVGSTFETEGPIEKVLTSSPATPLSFPPSESDEKPLLSKKKPSVNNIKKKKEQLLEIIEDFTRRNELLKKDVENKKRFLDQQKAENLELKAKKQKLCQTLPKEEEPRLGTSKSLNLELELTQFPMEIGNTITGSCQDYHHQQQISTRVFQPALIMDQLASNSNPEMNKNSEYPFGRMICWLPPSSTIGGLSKLHDNVCPPLGPLDLNVSAEEALGSLGFSSLKSVDQGTVADTKARAAQARLKRMQICRSKNHNAARKPHHPFR